MTFSITGTDQVTENSFDADGNEAPYTISHDGTLAPGETASIDVTQIFDDTISVDYETDLETAIQDAISALTNANISFNNGKTLQFDSGDHSSLTFTLPITDDRDKESGGDFQIRIDNPQVSNGLAAVGLYAWNTTIINDDLVDAIILDDGDAAPGFDTTLVG
ncbi:MAG: hypothetical protein R3C02_18750 [Planctomycetaceae bacterium]